MLYYTVAPRDKHVSAGNRTRAACVTGEHSSKELFEQFVNSYSEHQHMSARPVEKARDSLIFLKYALHKA